MTNPILSIQIPKPCHEDWGKMHPEEKGRHCSVCNTTVVDFSSKTDNEILDALKVAKGKTCGRFLSTQLNRPLNYTVDLRKLPRHMSVTKIFMVAAFLAFGTMLFSCTDHLNKKMGDLNVKVIQNDAGNKLIYQDVQRLPYPAGLAIGKPVTLKGEAIVNEARNINEEDTNTVVYVKGKIRTARPINIEPNEVTDSLLRVNTIERDSSGYMNHHFVLGGAVFFKTVASDSLTNEKVPATAEITGTENVRSNTVPELIVFPNPSTGNFTVCYTNKKRCDVLIKVFDANGAFIKNITQIAQQNEGQYNIQVDLSPLPNGIYLVSMIRDGVQVTKTVVVSK